MKKLLFIALAFSFFSCNVQKQFVISDYITAIESTSILDFRGYYIGPSGRGGNIRMIGFKPNRCKILFRHKNGEILSYSFEGGVDDNCMISYLENKLISLTSITTTFISNQLISFSSEQESYALISTLIADSTYLELKKSNPAYFDLTHRSKSKRFDRKYYYYNFIYLYDPENGVENLDYIFSRRTVYKINDHWYYYREIPTFFYKRF